jgi:serine/threonine-protein kinase
MLPDQLTMSRTFKVVGGNLVEDDSIKTIVSGQQAPPLAEYLSDDVIDGKYRVVRLLGEGGMGAVYQVMHLMLKKSMALKTFRDGQLSPDAWERFRREAHAIGKLTHQNIISVFDFGISENKLPYYTMELLEGESLAERLDRLGPMSVAEALPLFISVADGLAHAHRSGIVHRDIKPGNIFLVQGKETYTPKVVDFGLAQLAQSHSYNTQALTTVGLVFGSPLYMSPEQATGAPTNERTDIYSFGCTLFEALTGLPPFVGANAMATIALRLVNEAPRLDPVGELIFTLGNIVEPHRQTD